MQPTLYKLGKKLEHIKETPFRIERDIQHIFEDNLPQIMGLTFVKTEFTVKNKRIDSLAFNPETRAFVIIEYKRERNASVVDQGMTYLSLMLQNKADFILEYNELHPEHQLTRSGVDWSQSRVVFVSTDFTENQVEATNFKDLPIELFQVKRFGDHLLISSVQKSKAAESIKPFTGQNVEFKQVIDQIEVYTEEKLLSGKPERIVALYERFKSAILVLAADMEVKPLKWYVTFRKDNRTITGIEIQRSCLKLYINIKKGGLDDPKRIARDVSAIGHYSTGDYELKVTDEKNLEYIMSLVKQAVTE